MKGYVYAVTVIGPMDEKKASVATFLLVVFCPPTNVVIQKKIVVSHGIL